MESEPLGKKITIYLANADVLGVRHAEIVNWTGQALAFPRSNAPDACKWPEMKRQGVYFLFGQDDSTGRDSVYIGEAEIVAQRIIEHLKRKEFWSECIAFTSKDENLTKSHIKFLESRLVEAAKHANRYLVTNSTMPTESGLPRSDRDSMVEFSIHIRTLLGVLGHRVLDPLLSAEKKYPGNTTHTIEPPTRPYKTQTYSGEFTLKSGPASARAYRDGDTLVVRQGSIAAASIQSSLGEGYRSIRGKLEGSGILSQNNGTLIFTQDYPFSSPTQAAAVLVGYAVNGRQSWKTVDGKSLEDILDEEANAITDKLLSELQAST